MAELGNQEPVPRAREAIARQAWQESYDVLSEADRSHRLDTDGLALFAEVSYLVGDPGASGDAWRRVHAARLSEGDPEGAAAAAARIAHILFDEGLVAPLRGWVMKARELLADHPGSPVHGALFIEMAWAAVVSGDGEEALEEARRAVEIANRTGDATTRALATNAEGRALIVLGQIQEGLALLDESTVAAMSGELDGMSTVVLFCSTVCALQALAEYDRADQWTQAMEQWCADRPLGPFQGVCRVHRAEILRLRGAWHDAEREVRRACDEMRPYARTVIGWPLTELGSVRLRLGDLDGAEDAFIQASEAGWEPQPGLALLRLAQGDLHGADAEIRGALDHPSEITSWERPPNTQLRRAPLLAAQVEIAIATDDLDRGRWAADELDQIALAVGSKAIKASAATARGAMLLAEKDVPAAIRSLEDGATKWKEIGAPFESARARLSLALAHRSEGNEERAMVELRAARSTLHRLGATLEAARAAEAMGAEPSDDRVPEAVDKVFLFTDIVRSTNLLDAIGDEAWGHLVHWHNQKLTSLVLAHGGEVVRMTGDGFFVTFDSAGDGAECAVAVQRALEEHRREHGFSPEVRIGLHSASANPDGRDWSGKGVHEAARIGALADGSQILASRKTAEAAGRGYDATQLRVVSLKGISEPVEVVAIDWR